MEMDQLKMWEGDFGKAYTWRNTIDWRTRVPAFQKMLEGLSIEGLLEVGCNRGHNLIALSHLLADPRVIVGIEPNNVALDLARKASDKVKVLPASAFALPFKECCFDLVFTAGVLIHIPLPQLPNAISEIYRVSSRYILAIEYYAEQETALPYRGYDNFLWKRDFLKHYEERFSDLRLIRSGFWGLEDGFDQTQWWLLEKGFGSKRDDCCAREGAGAGILCGDRFRELLKEPR